MRVGYINKTFVIPLETDDSVPVLTDVSINVVDTAGVPVAGSPFAAARIGSTKVYQANWLPSAIGTYFVNAVIPSQSFVGRQEAVFIEERSTTDAYNLVDGLNNISTADVWSETNRTITDKTGFELDAGQYTAIADAVQTAILNEGDGRLVIDAIVQAIGNANVDEATLISSIRGDIERAGGLAALTNTAVGVVDSKIDTLDGKIDIITANLEAGGTKFRILS